MNRCEDYPDCGHESGCCPDHKEPGRQLEAFCCLCKDRIAVSSPLESICKDCYDKNMEDEGEYFGTYMDDI